VPELPIVFFDHPVPDLYRDLTQGRMVAVGPQEGLEHAVGVIAGAKRAWNAAEFENAPQLKVLSRLGIGYDNVNVADATAAGVTVCNAPVAPSVSTAEHTIALMLAVTKELVPQMDRATAGLPGSGVGSSLELYGQTLGLVGFGRIAQRVAVAGLSMGMNVLAHDPYLETSPIDQVPLVSLEHLVSSSAVLSLHAPATPETHHLVNSDVLSAMPAGSYLVNCARGALVDQDALIEALDRGHLAGAALDVTDPEPLPEGHPLLGRKDVIVTPHIASSTGAGRRRLYEHAIENVVAVLNGLPATIVTK
jgi:phosphoglycerate dehydrogenase-like enzyme